MPPSTDQPSIHPVTGRIGAEVRGIRITAGLRNDDVAFIRDALLRHRVVFFRDQHHIDDESQIEFARRLGPINAAHPILGGHGGRDPVVRFDSAEIRANKWHTDVTFIDRPPSISVFRPVVIPSVGGDTLWANTVSAYDDLPAALKELVDGLWAVHTNQRDYAQRGDRQTKEFAARLGAQTFEAEHPVVRIHPETGERSLLLGLTATRFIGLSSEQSATLHSQLQRVIERPENTVRWRWALGDFAIWDNRATQHFGVSDYVGDRLVHRVTIDGDAPVSIDGRAGRLVTGDASDFYRYGATQLEEVGA